MTTQGSDAGFRSYYGQPVLKPPVWKVPDVPAYLYLGGMAGASAMMAEAAGATGWPALGRTGRVVAAAGSSVSVLALMHDLGRPARFLNMLRVFKPTSPLSVGSWILAPFSAASAAAAASEITGWWPAAGRAAGAVAAALGPAMTTYTAVLLADTAVPGWHEVYRELPFVFAGGAVLSAGAAGMLSTAAPSVRADQVRPAATMAVAGSALELAATSRLHRRAGGLLGEVYRSGRAGTALTLAQALTVAGATTAVLAARSRVAAIGSGLCLTAAAMAARYGVFDAGRVSARDPRYTVVPQRQRLQQPTGR